MMQAVDTETGRIIAGEDARRQGRYLCPGCGALVGLRWGERKLPHFAHLAVTRCALAVPESPRHRMLKWLCKSFFAPLPVEWEVAVGARQADAMVDGRFVVECQASPVSPMEWQKRTENHNAAGYPVLWLWDVKRVCGKNTIAEALTLERNCRALLIPAEIRRCHEESGELIFAADKHELRPCRLTPLTVGEQAAARRQGSPAAQFWPQSLRRLTFLAEFEKTAWTAYPTLSGKLRLVRPRNTPEPYPC